MAYTFWITRIDCVCGRTDQEDVKMLENSDYWKCPNCGRLFQVVYYEPEPFEE